jgi:hypothetical protein
MRKRALTLGCVLLFTLGMVNSSRAFSDGTPEAVAADALVVRPFCFAATILGSAVFLVALPVAAISKSTDKAAEALVAAPAKATFTRPLGKMSDL